MRLIATICLSAVAALFLFGASNIASAANPVLQDWKQHPRTEDQEVSIFCAKAKMTCVIDMTARSTRCDYAEPFHVDIETATPLQGRTLLAQRCAGYRWRTSGSIYIFEPRNIKESALGVEIEAFDSGTKCAPGSFIIQLASAAGISEPPAQSAGGGFKPAMRRLVRYKTPAGTMKDALISAAKQYPGTTWSVALSEKGYRIEAKEPSPPAALPQMPKR